MNYEPRLSSKSYIVPIPFLLEKSKVAESSLPPKEPVRFLLILRGLKLFFKIISSQKKKKEEVRFQYLNLLVLIQNFEVASKKYFPQIIK